MILLVNVKVDFSFFPIFKLKEVKWHVNCKIVEKVQLRLEFFFKFFENHKELFNCLSSYWNFKVYGLLIFNNKLREL